MIYPRISTHVKPHILLNDYPKSQKLFNESLAVARDSPRAGLTLSRMCLESLTKDILIQKGEKIAKKQTYHKNVEKLLELEIITNKLKIMLDSTRLIGNEAVHNFINYVLKIQTKK